MSIFNGIHEMKFDEVNAVHFSPLTLRSV